MREIYPVRLRCKAWNQSCGKLPSCGIHSASILPLLPMTNVEDRSVWSRRIYASRREAALPAKVTDPDARPQFILLKHYPSRAGTKVHPRPWNHLVLRGSPSGKRVGNGVAVPEADFPCFVALAHTQLDRQQKLQVNFAFAYLSNFSMRVRLVE